MTQSNPDIREVTPAIVAGMRAGLRERADIVLDGGHDATLLAFGSGKAASTVVLTKVRSSLAFVPALACRDRAATRGRPAELPTERWEEAELESEGFDRRYLLLALEGQDAGLLRELFSPSLIAWLERNPPPGFGFELNEGFLAISLPGHPEPNDRARLIALAADVATRIEAEMAEEGGVSLDVFSEGQELRDLDRALEDIGSAENPESVQAAVAAAKRRAGSKPATLLRALVWAAIAGAIAAATAVLVHPLAGALVAFVLVPLSLWLGWMVSRAAYRWGTISVSRAGLELWTRGYAATRGLEAENRWRFHATHRSLPVPGFADHVLAGTLPGSQGIRGRLLFLGDAAELRVSGQEMAFTAERPLASSALMVQSDAELAAGAADELELPEDYTVEIAGRDVLVWRPVQGNMLRTSAGTDRFCERAARVAREVLARDGPNGHVQVEP